MSVYIHSLGLKTIIPPNSKLAVEKCQTSAAQPREANVDSPFLPSSPYMGLLPLGPARRQRNFVSVQLTTLPYIFRAWFSGYPWPNSVCAVEERWWAMTWSLLHNLTSPRSKKHGMPNCLKERSQTPATQIQMHIISDRAADVLFLGFKGKRYLLVEALEVIVNPGILSLRM